MDEKAIIELYFNRNEQALALTQEKYGKYLGKIAYNILRDEGESDECVNDTLFKAWRSIPPSNPNSLKAYLGRIARNSALDRYKARGRQKRGGDEVTLCLDELGECVSGSESSYAPGEITAAINAFLRQESPEDRRIFALRYFHTERICDIAKRLGYSEGLIKVRLHRMRERLRTVLMEEELL